MWILHFLPDAFLLFVVNTILVVGVVGCFLSFVVINRVLRFFPPLANYYHVLQIVSAVVLVLGIYFKGGYSVEMQWRERVAELEQQISIAEAKSDQYNKDLVAEQEKKQKVRTEVKVVIQERIRIQKELIDAECKVPNEAIKILNDSAKLQTGTVTVDTKGVKK